MLRLIQTDNGQFDLAFSDPASANNMDDVETIIYAALFTDQEAPDDWVNDRYDRRGWWADPAAGSGLWYVRRQALSDEARMEALDMVRRTLEKRSAGLSDVVVAIDGLADPSNLYLIISGTYKARKFTTRVPL